MSLDGFRYDFVSPVKTPNIWSLAQRGVYASKGIKVQVTTVTASNHQTMATGLHQESHGIIDNVFEDPVFKESYDLWGFGGHGKAYQGSKLSKWYAGEPIWQTNMKITGRLSGTYHWPAGDAIMNDIKKHKYKTWTDYNDKMNAWKADIDEMLNWFVKDSPPVNFVLYYNAYPDATEHRSNIYGSEVEKIIHQLDDLIGYLVAECRRIKIFEKLNLIITSDHGFVNVPSEFPGASIHNYVDNDRVKQNSNSFFALDGKESTEEEIYKNLSKAVSDGMKIKVWRKRDFPDKYHWKNNRRIGPVIFFHDIEPENLSSPNLKHASSIGTHLDFLNDDRRLRALFVAHGPALKKGFILERDDVENVDYYPLMCHILGVAPAPNNGSLDRIGSILNGIETKQFDEVRSKVLGKDFYSAKTIMIIFIVFGCSLLCYSIFHVCVRCDTSRRCKFYLNRQPNLYVIYCQRIFNNFFNRKSKGKRLAIEDVEPFIKNFEADDDDDV